MSLQLNISSKEILEAYQSILSGSATNWALFSYSGGSNDLKLQGSGDGGLEELQEEFSDGRSVSCFPSKEPISYHCRMAESNMPLLESKTRMSVQ
jgi:hypothetical protein